jgi:hypothetical protein
VKAPSGVALLCATALFAALLAPPLVSASYDPVGSGTTTITLDRSFRSLLAEHGVKLLTAGPAIQRGPTYILPASGGQLDPTKAKGVVEQSGLIVFQRGTRRLPLRKIELKTKSEPLVAKVGGSQLKVLSATRLEVRREGFGTSVRAPDLRLTAKFATRLGKKLRLHDVFEQGQLFGTMQSAVQPETVATLDTGRATIALDPALVAKLNSLFVSINPIFPTELSPGSVLSVPIIRDGALSPDASIGTLRTAGAVEFLQQGAGQVFLNEFWFDLGARAALAEIDIEPTPTFKGKLGQLSALTIGPATASSNPRSRTITISSAPLALTASSAAAFNEAFAGSNATFVPGEAFGTLSFTAQAQ